MQVLVLWEILCTTLRTLLDHMVLTRTRITTTTTTLLRPFDTLVSKTI